jgi:hypothetical protein
MATDGCITVPVRRAGVNWNALLVVGFLTVSALDLLLTWRLLTTPGDCFYEANPLAQHILKTTGWWGLGLFKLACAGTVVGVSAVLARRRPWAARAVLALAVPVVCLVVGYSLALAGGSERRAILAAHERQSRLDQQKRDQLGFQEKVSQVARQVLARQRTLPEAAQVLHAYMASLRYNPLQALEHYYPTLTDEARLAVRVFREASYLLRKEPAESQRAALARLTAEFTAAYSCPIPPPNGPNFADAVAPAAPRAPLMACAYPSTQRRNACVRGDRGLSMT